MAAVSSRTFSFISSISSSRLPVSSKTIARSIFVGVAGLENEKSLTITGFPSSITVISSSVSRPSSPSGVCTRTYVTTDG